MSTFLLVSQVSHKLDNGMKMLKGIGITSILLFYLNGPTEYMMALPEVNYSANILPHSDLREGGCFKKNHQQGNQFQCRDVESKKRLGEKMTLLNNILRRNYLLHGAIEG